MKENADINGNLENSNETKHYKWTNKTKYIKFNKKTYEKCEFTKKPGVNSVCPVNANTELVIFIRILLIGDVADTKATWRGFFKENMIVLDPDIIISISVSKITKYFLTVFEFVLLAECKVLKTLVSYQQSEIFL